jgi:DNA-binding NtrC family response regulator
VRQLKNTIERAAYLSRGGLIEPADLHLGRRERRIVASAPEHADSEASGGPSFEEELYAQPFKEAKQIMVDQFERRYFTRLLDKTDNNLSRASGEAGITRYYLRELLKRLGMHRVREEEG